MQIFRHARNLTNRFDSVWLGNVLQMKKMTVYSGNCFWELFFKQSPSKSIFFKFSTGSSEAGRWRKRYSRSWCRWFLIVSFLLSPIKHTPVKTEFEYKLQVEKTMMLALTSGGWKQICPEEPKIVRLLAQYDHINRKLYYLENWHSCRYGNSWCLNTLHYRNSLKIV